MFEHIPGNHLGKMLDMAGLRMPGAMGIVPLKRGGGAPREEVKEEHIVKDTIKDEELQHHFAACKEFMHIHTLEESGFESFRKLVARIDSSPENQVEIFKGPGNAPLVWHQDASKEARFRHLIDSYGLLPLMAFEGGEGPGGRPLVIGVRPHSLEKVGASAEGFHDEDFRDLRSPEELVQSVMDDLMPHLHNDFGAYRPFRKDDISFVFLPNDTFEKAEEFLRNEDARQAYLRRIKGADYNGLVIFREVLRDTLALRGSDIHFEPINEETYMIQVRVDGKCQELPFSLDESAFKKLLGAIEGLSGKSYKDPKKPWDAGISFLRSNSEHEFTSDESRLSFQPSRGLDQPTRIPWPEEFVNVNLRINKVPVSCGHKMTIRVQESSAISRIEDLGLRPEVEEVLKRKSRQKEGMIVLTGPTGSGKTTTLYASLLSSYDAGLQYYSAEDPVERDLPGIHQTPINEETGMTFSKAIRSLMRQDPDVILVGEMRDQETGTVAINASNTGHLVWTTLHTNESVGIPGRMRGLVESSQAELVASNLILAVGQRLVPKYHLVENAEGKKVIPGQYFEYYDAKDELNELMGREVFTEPVQLIRPKAETDPEEFKPYEGRMPMVEVLDPDDRIRDLIREGAPEHEIRRTAMAREKDPYLPIPLYALKQVRDGHTSLAAVANALGTEMYRNPEFEDLIVDILTAPTEGKSEASQSSSSPTEEAATPA